MDLYQLRYFLEAARTLSFARAAENCHISGPAVSRSIALLERSVSQRLFHRVKRRVELTPAGERLRKHAQRAFDELDAARLSLDAEKGPASIRIASRELITNYLLPGPLREMRRRFPQTRIGLFSLAPRALAEALKTDRIDFGFTYSDIADSTLQSRSLGRLRSHIYAAKGRFTDGPPLEQPFIAPRTFEDAGGAPSPDGFPDGRLERDIHYGAEFLETHRRFVLEGVAVGVLPDLVMQKALARGAVRRLPGPRIYREIFFIKRRGRPLPGLVEDLLSGVRKAIANAGGARPN